MIQSSFLFENTNLEDKMTKLTSSIDICVVSSNLHEIHDTVSDGHVDIFALQQDVRTYAGNLIYAVRLQVNVRDRDRLKKSFSALLHCSEKTIRKWVDEREKVT